jgi:hypothetical protein
MNGKIFEKEVNEYKMYFDFLFNVLFQEELSDI